VYHNTAGATTAKGAIVLNVTDDLQLLLANWPEIGPNRADERVPTDASACHGLVAKEPIPTTLPDPLMVARGVLADFR
jgi:hypothetical protein